MQAHQNHPNKKKDIAVSRRNTHDNRINSTIQGDHLMTAGSETASLIFVYGTLMKNHRNHHYLTEAVLIDKCIIENYALYELGSYPGIVPAANSMVLGELYQVEPGTLEILDKLENEGSEYIRRRVTAVCATCTIDGVFTYVYDYPVQKENLLPFKSQPWRNGTQQSYVWYAAYGSNLLYDRLMTYINGGICRYNRRFHTGTTVKNPPIASHPVTIPYLLYFGNNSQTWGGGGVCFLDIATPGRTLGRMYLITENQFKEIHHQEGLHKNWYPDAVDLGTYLDVPVRTITNSVKRSIQKPDQSYLDVFMQGLRETYPEMTEIELGSYVASILHEPRSI